MQTPDVSGFRSAIAFTQLCLYRAQDATILKPMVAIAGELIAHFRVDDGEGPLVIARSSLRGDDSKVSSFDESIDDCGWTFIGSDMSADRGKSNVQNREACCS